MSSVSGFQDSVRLVADEAAGVIFCGLPSGAEKKIRQVIDVFFVKLCCIVEFKVRVRM